MVENYATSDLTPLGAIHLWRPQNFRIFWPPPPLVCIWSRYTVLNSRNFPYFIFFWPNPPYPLCADVINGWPLITGSAWLLLGFFPLLVPVYLACARRCFRCRVVPPVPQSFHHELAQVVWLLVGVCSHGHEGKSLKKCGKFTQFSG